MFLALASTRRFPTTARPRLPLHRLPVVLRACLAAVGVAVLLLVPARARAQAPGDLDTTFTSALTGADFYAFTFEEINNTRYIFIAGDAGLSQREYEADGSVDRSFGLEDFGFPTQRIIYTAVNEQVLTDGYSAPKVLIGGLFGRNGTQVSQNQPAQNIKRFFPTDGALDPSFNPGSGANNYVTSILPLADGSMVVGGEFDQFNKLNHAHIVKLDNSGAIVDNSVFSSGLAFDSTVLTLAQQYTPGGSGSFNGQILAGGTFSNVNGQTQTKLARINADGSVDTSFAPVFSDRVRVVVSQPDGKILAGGDFESVNGTAVKHLVRLNYDGSLDTTFNCLVTDMPAGINTPVAVNTITPLGDGRYYVGGAFYKVNGVSRHYLARVLADGSVDEFDANTTLDNVVQQVAIDPVTNKVFVTTNRDKTVNGVYPPSVFRLFGDPVPPPSVNISATVATGTRTQKGQFTITRTTVDNSSPLRVYFTRGGTAKNRGPAIINPSGPPTQRPGDYVLQPPPTKNVDLAGQTDFFVTIPANSNSVTIAVKATKTARAGRTVTLTLQSDQTGADSYTVGSVPAATVTLD